MNKIREKLNNIIEKIKERFKGKSLFGIINEFAMEGMVAFALVGLVISITFLVMSEPRKESTQLARNMQEVREESVVKEKKGEAENAKKEEKKADSKKEDGKKTDKNTDEKVVASAKQDTKASGEKGKVNSGNAGNEKGNNLSSNPLENSETNNNPSSNPPAATPPVNNGTSNKPSAKPEEKVWVEPVYQSVSYPEEGYYETVVIFPAWSESTVTGSYVLCGKCSATFDTVEAWLVHSGESGRGGCGNYSTQPTYGTVNHPAVTEQQWRVTRAARTENVLVTAGYWK